MLRIGFAALAAVVMVQGALAQVPQVQALGETDAVASANDAADDPAIWPDGKDPAQSRIVATDKKGGLYVYDLKGKALQFVPAGLVNNVDLREGFDFAEGSFPIVAASDRDDQSIAIFRFDTASRQLDPVQKAVIPTGFDEVYGICLYRNKAGAYHAIATSKTGRVRQWLLSRNGSTIDAKLLRDFELGTITEGCVADDAQEALYLAQEDVALWRLAADPDKGDAKTAVDRIGPHLAADIEGLALYARADGSGYLIASSQGNSTYAVYDRITNAYLGSFAIGDGAVDGVTGTDGIEVSAANLGPDYPGGLFVAQDDVNTSPAAAQNFKLVPFARIEAAISKAAKP